VGGIAYTICNTTIGLKAVKYESQKLRNELPSHLKYCNSTNKFTSLLKYIYVRKLLIKHTLLIWYFHYTALLNWWTDFFCVFLCSILFFISVFLCLCFYALYFVVLLVTIISYHGRSARWSTPFWQPVYCLHLMCTFTFFMANKLCQLCCCY